MLNYGKAQEESIKPEQREGLVAACRDLIAAGKSVEAVKKYRTETGADLYEARQALNI